MLEEQLKQVALRLQDAQVERDMIIDKGRRAYRMGYEKRANPLNSPTHRVLWDRGYDLELESFQSMLQRWKSL